MERAKTALVDSDPTVDAYLELVRAHEEMATALARVFQGHGVTQQQYNVLRILYVRDKGDGLPCSAISARLVNRVPDMTRLLDRLEKAGLVTRHRCTSDRRVVRTRLSEEGMALVERIHGPLHAAHARLATELDPGELDELTRLLRKLRNGVARAEDEDASAAQRAAAEATPVEASA